VKAQERAYASVQSGCFVCERLTYFAQNPGFNHPFCHNVHSIMPSAIYPPIFAFYLDFLQQMAIGHQNASMDYRKLNTSSKVWEV